MNCTNCGSPIPAGANNCPACGTVLNNNQGIPVNEMPSQQPMGTPVSVMPPIKNRSIGMAIILSFVTCGIYSIIWLISMTDESNSLSDYNKTASGGLTILFILLSCGVYGMYWYYKMGKKLHEAGIKYGRPVSDNSVLYLILGIFGLGIVSECLIQSDLNKFANQ